MEWQTFTETNIEFPEESIEKMIKGFDKATKYLLSLDILPIEGMQRMASKLDTDFQFELLLTTKYLSNYSFQVLRFGYDVEFYPIRMIVDEDIRNQIFSIPNLFQINNEQELNNTIIEIFKSKKFNDTVSGLMKIANKNKENEPVF